VLFLDPNAVNLDQAKHIVMAALKGLGESVSALKMASYTIGVALHGTVKGIGAAEFIGQFVSAVPDGVGPNTGNGIAFYFGHEGDRWSSSLTLDMSVAYSEAIFARASATFAGTLEPEAVSALADNYLTSLLKKAGLEV
jgi:hypothetical protein